MARSTEGSRCITNGQMTFSEYERLRQLYEAALRRWERAMWSPNTDIPGKPQRLASEMKHRAYFERNEAHERMHFHKQSCSVCKLSACTAKSRSDRCLNPN
jgi:hypothetical protein